MSAVFTHNIAHPPSGSGTVHEGRQVEERGGSLLNTAAQANMVLRKTMAPLSVVNSVSVNTASLGVCFGL